MPPAKPKTKRALYEAHIYTVQLTGEHVRRYAVCRGKSNVQKSRWALDVFPAGADPQVAKPTFTIHVKAADVQGPVGARDG